jgi:hypothetical protein
MRRVQFYAVLWTLALAIPFAALALVGSAILTERMGDIARLVAAVVDWSRMAIEGSARWPEVAGMIVGQIAILTILLLVRRDERAETTAAA